MSTTNSNSEQWRVVPSHPEYEVSDRGRVRSATSGAPIPQHLKSQRGYPSVSVPRGKTPYVHAMVLEAFIGPRPSGAVTRHINDDPRDNRLENLTWGTHSENALDRVANGNDPYARRTHCKNGHPLTGSNVCPGLSFRRCRTCQRLAKQRSRTRLQSALIPAGAQ
ncbi:NUMOD4 motif-containing HNH endonuclease [Mycolicibacterium fluoranthenivorans]|nr:HNH endonuclease [Mycolicibacterium fluoranthenivorans]